MYLRQQCVLLLNDYLQNCYITIYVHVQKRYSMMELYNKQSLKTVQQHVSSINMQITKCRSVSLSVCK